MRSTFKICFFSILAVLMLAACSSQGPNPAPDSPLAQKTTESQDRCEQGFDFEILHLDPAGRVATLGEEFQIEALGEAGALDLAGELLSLDGSYCDLPVPGELVQALDEIGRLIETGQDSLANEKIDDLLIGVEQDAFSRHGKTKITAERTQQGGARARRAVRAYLAIAARAQIWGNDDRADAAIDSATQAYEAWASGAIEGATMQEALTIAAEAQLLGLSDLGDEAIARASELAEQAYIQAMQAFEPCLASLQEARDLLRTVAIAMLLGVDTGQDFMVDIETWRDIQLRRKNGEAVPECDAWTVKLDIHTIWEAGEHTIAWQGFFKVQEDQTLQGQGTGTLYTHVEITCVDVMSGAEFLSTTDVSGTFSFEIEGIAETREEGEVFKFQLPAEVSLSGTDTCNPFEEATYLPKYVIEEIHGSGGVEGYDMATDEIYLVIPAEDGASKTFDTVIGPVTLTLAKGSDQSE